MPATHIRSSRRPPASSSTAAHMHVFEDDEFLDSLDIGGGLDHTLDPKGAAGLHDSVFMGMPLSISSPRSIPQGRHSNSSLGLGSERHFFSSPLGAPPRNHSWAGENPFLTEAHQHAGDSGTLSTSQPTPAAPISAPTSTAMAPSAPAAPAAVTVKAPFVMPSFRRATSFVGRQEGFELFSPPEDSFPNTATNSATNNSMSIAVTKPATMDTSSRASSTSDHRSQPQGREGEDLAASGDSIASWDAWHTNLPDLPDITSPPPYNLQFATSNGSSSPVKREKPTSAEAKNNNNNNTLVVPSCRLQRRNSALSTSHTTSLPVFHTAGHSSAPLAIGGRSRANTMPISVRENYFSSDRTSAKLFDDINFESSFVGYDNNVLGALPQDRIAELPSITAPPCSPELLPMPTLYRNMSANKDDEEEDEDVNTGRITVNTIKRESSYGGESEGPDHMVLSPAASTALVNDTKRASSGAQVKVERGSRITARVHTAPVRASPPRRASSRALAHRATTDAASDSELLSESEDDFPARYRAMHREDSDAGEQSDSDEEYTPGARYTSKKRSKKKKKSKKPKRTTKKVAVSMSPMTRPRRQSARRASPLLTGASASRRHSSGSTSPLYYSTRSSGYSSSSAKSRRDRSRTRLDNIVTIGIYTKAERRLKIERFHAKRLRRTFTKKIMYKCRKNFADARPRVGGRFVKMAPKPDTQAAAAGKGRTSTTT